MQKLVKSILNHKIIILIISFFLLIFGVYSYYNMPKQEMPQIDILMGTTQIVAPGLSANQVQENIVEDVEDVLSSYNELEEYTSKAYDNIAIIMFELDLNTKNLEEIFDNIENEILNIDYDDAVSKVKVETDFDTPEVIYAVSSDNLLERELENVADYLAEMLKDVDNVNRTKVNSAYSKEVKVKIDSDKLDKTPLTTGDIINIISSTASELPLGSIDVKAEKAGSIIVNSKFTEIDDIENIVVHIDETGEYLLKDIADVSVEDTGDKVTYSFNGKNVVFVEMYFQEGIDFVKMGNQTKDIVSDFKKAIPQDINIETMSFSPDYVKEQVNEVIINLLQCMLIVMIVVLIGLGIRNALCIAITIPVIVMSTIGILYYTGNSLQLMTIAGLIVSIGILVDNAIVISEAVQHYLDMGMERKEASVRAVTENYLPILTSTLTTVASFAPLLTLPGIAGEIVFSLPLTILITITLSFVAAMVLTPVLASVLFRPSNKQRKMVLKDNLFLQKIIKKLFKFSYFPTIISFVILCISAVCAFSFLEIDMLPRPEKSVIYIDYEYGELNDGENSLLYAETIASAIQIEPDVINVAYSQGGNMPRFDMMVRNVDNLPQNGRIFAEFDCKSSELKKHMEFLNQKLKPLEQYGSFSIHRIEFSGSDAPVTVGFYGDDINKLKAAATKIFDNIQNIDSFEYGELIVAHEKLDFELELDDEKLMQYGLTSIGVQSQIAQAVNGKSGEYFDDSINQHEVVVGTNIEYTSDLLEMNILNASGEKIALKDIADSNNVSNLEYIQSTNGEYCVMIDAYMADGYSSYNLQSDINSIIIGADMDDIKVEFSGENQMTNEIFGGLGIALAIALFAIYLIMYFQFKSFSQPLIIFISIPLSFIGSFLAMIILGEKITLTGMLGLVSLVGIVVNNGILLVENINRLRNQGSSLHESCLKATNRRLRPILLTSCTTILGLLPLAVFGGDFFRPMAVSFMGGLIISTVTVLFLIPSLYYTVYKNRI